MEYTEVQTKKEYESLIEEMLLETQALIKRFPQLGIYQAIYDQLQDIKTTIIIKKTRLDEEEIDERYTLGMIVTNNFDSDNELYAAKLEDVFGATFEYFDLK